jgi:hypothetical protein
MFNREEIYDEIRNRCYCLVEGLRDFADSGHPNAHIRKVSDNKGFHMEVTHIVERDEFVVTLKGTWDSGAINGPEAVEIVTNEVWAYLTTQVFPGPDVKGIEDVVLENKFYDYIKLLF